MRVRYTWGLALLGATALAGTGLAHAQGTAPPIKRQVAIAAAPINPVPDAGETDGLSAGPEARDAMGAGSGEVAQVMAGSLNAQYAQLQPAVVAPAAAAAAPAPAQLLPMVASVPAESALPSPAVAPEAAAVSSGPSVALARRVVESAEAFADYMGRASALKPTYADASGVARAVSAGGAYEQVQLEEGMVSYVALVALQDPDFVRSVDGLARQGYRATLVQGLSADPRAIMQMPSSAPAAARAAKALGRMGSALMAAGAGIKQSSYDMQHSAWSKLPAPTANVMLADLKARSALREVMPADGGQAMLGTLTQLRTADVDGGSGRLTPVVAQGLTLAALAVLGEAGEEHADRVANLLSDAKSAECLKMARLNLYQCLSVAGPSYEDAFCLGQHAMIDTAQCVAQSSGWSAPARGVSVPVATPQSSSVMVPVALGVAAAPAGSAVSAPAVPVAYGDPADATPAGAPPPMGGPAYGYGAPSYGYAGSAGAGLR
jgi:hypothetical protein